MDATAQIIKASLAGGKTYEFDEKHDSNRPAQMWFQESDEGLVLFVVFYTQACRWSKCLGCNLPSKCSANHVSWRHLMAQVDHVFGNKEVLAMAKEIKKMIVSNNGSVLDEETFSSTALIYLMAKINLHFLNMRVISLETRPEYIQIPELEFLSRVLKEGNTPTELEIAIGFEAFDERIRNEVFVKGLSLNVFEDLAEKTARYGFKLKCYFMQKPVPGMTDEEAVLDIKRAIDYLGYVSAKYSVPINMHLNPTYAAYGTRLEEYFRAGTYVPPKLIDVARAAACAENRLISVYLGLFDEGLAVPGGSFVRDGDESLIAELEKFNRTQDFGILKSVLS